MFIGKKIVVGVTGGIAAYKAAELAREFIKLSAEVRVVMTESATKFVAPLTFETLSGKAVLTDLFPKEGGLSTVHIDWARWPDAMVICPATANTVGKLASGIADNALTTVVAATTVPVILCPAMNKEMYANKIYQSNQAKLQESGYRIVQPGQGELACGEEGWGRLADLADIVDEVKKAILSTTDFSGKRFLVTAGPTEEPLDPVRFLTNPSTGKMGFALAERAALRGAEVTLVSGPTRLRRFSPVRLLRVRTAAEMGRLVQEHLPNSDVLIMAAAVSDFRPKTVLQQKLKKKGGAAFIELEENEDILAQAALTKGERLHIGFSVETENEVENSISKLRAKGLDFIVLNNPLEAGAGFAVDTNRVKILDADGGVEDLPIMSKLAVADKVLDRIHDLIQGD